MGKQQMREISIFQEFSVEDHSQTCLGQQKIEKGNVPGGEGQWL